MHGFGWLIADAIIFVFFVFMFIGASADKKSMGIILYTFIIFIAVVGLVVTGLNILIDIGLDWRVLIC